MFLMPGARARSKLVRVRGSRLLLTSGQNYYVDANNGEDFWQGTQANPWKTLQHAASWIASMIDFGQFNVALQCADATYAENLVLPSYVASGKLAQATMVIQGNAGAHSNVIIQPASGNAITAVDIPMWWTLKNLKIAASGQGIVADHSRIAIDGVVFGACNIHKQAVNTGAMVEGINNSYTISANAAVHDDAVDGGEILNQAIAVNGSGTLTFSAAFTQAQNGGIVDYQSNTFAVTTSGTIKYVRDITSSIFVAGGADPNTIIPGNTNGSTAQAVANGGTGAVSASAARTNLGLAGRGTHGDANVTLSTSDMPFVQLVAVLTAQRTWQLPLSTACAPGDRLTISDAGGINGSNTLVVTRQGSDNFSGVGVSANAYTITSQFGTATVETDGAGGWYLVGKT